MVWNSAGEFFFMGGYGLYVWGSVAATAGLMVIEVMLVRHRMRAAHRGLERRMAVDDEDIDTVDDLEEHQGARRA